MELKVVVGGGDGGVVGVVGVVGAGNEGFERVGGKIVGEEEGEKVVGH